MIAFPVPSSFRIYAPADRIPRLVGINDRNVEMFNPTWIRQRVCARRLIWEQPGGP